MSEIMIAKYINQKTKLPITLYYETIYNTYYAFNIDGLYFTQTYFNLNNIQQKLIDDGFEQVKTQIYVSPSKNDKNDDYISLEDAAQIENFEL